MPNLLPALIVSAAAIGGWAPGAPGPSTAAVASPGALSRAASPPHQIDVNVVNLSPIVVNGQHLPLPVALQVVKQALNRPWSASQADRNKLVCRFEYMIASHFKTLMCETNAQYFGQRRAVQLGLEKALSTSYAHKRETVAGLQVALERGYLTGAIGEFMNEHPINQGALMTMLHYLPPAGSSYTLQVTDHGKPVIAYVIRNGELVKVYALKRATRGQGGS